MRSVSSLFLVLSLAAAMPASAQDTPELPPGEEEQEEDSRSLMEQGMELFFRGLREEMEPAMRDLREFAEGVEPALRDFALEMGPALRELLEEVEDWSAYHPPEKLPNGDIILRKKRPEEIDPPADEGGNIDI